MDKVKIKDQEYEVQLPGLGVCRDLVVAYNENPRRAELAALGLCVGAALPRWADSLPLGVAGYRTCKGSVYDFAERVEEHCQRLAVPYKQMAKAASECWTLAANTVLPGLLEVVSRADFSSAPEGATTTTPSASD